MSQKTGVKNLDLVLKVVEELKNDSDVRGKYLLYVASDNPRLLNQHTEKSYSTILRYVKFFKELYWLIRDGENSEQIRRLKNENINLKADYDTLKAENTRLKTENDNLKAELRMFREE